MMHSQYKKVSSFGSNAYTTTDNPVTSCIGRSMAQRFTHGGAASAQGQDCQNCQMFLSQYCAGGWDEYCELASTDQSTSFPNTIGNCNSGVNNFPTGGEQLIRNTAERKYMVETNGCVLKYQPFDPNVATSPNVYWWDNDCNSNCTMFFAVDPKTIDSDIVMDKILAKPSIAMDILNNIYSTMKKKNTLRQLSGTKIGYFFSNNPVFKKRGGLS